MVANFGFPIVSGVIDGKVGGNYSNTFGHENFELTDPTGLQPPISSISPLHGYDWGMYAQTAIRPVVGSRRAWGCASTATSSPTPAIRRL